MFRHPQQKPQIPIRLSAVSAVRLLLLGLATAFFGFGAETALQSGLIATFADADHAVTRVVAVPELGLAAEESAHPAISPAFTATYEGLLQIEQSGRYAFTGMDEIWLDGRLVNGPVELQIGVHPLRLVYRRPPGPVSVGIVWQSNHFVQEPLPPTVLQHDGGKAHSVGTVPAGQYPSPPLRIQQTLTAFKCGSCHDAAYLASMHHKHPPEALLRLMQHTGRKWHGAPMGPRLDPVTELKQLVADLAKLPRYQRERPKAATPDSTMVEMVGTKGGFGCIACHDFGTHVAMAESRGPNLLQIRSRVSYDWFFRWMANPGRIKPGVPMPAFFAHLPAAEQAETIGKLWDYLSAGTKAPLPKELVVDRNDFRLKPGTTPIMMRTAMKLPDGRELQRAICVGFPGGMSACFDAERCQLAYVWSGGFLDMAPHWQDKAGRPTPAIGTTVVLFPETVGLSGAEAPRFTGYDVSTTGPTFQFQIGAAQVSLAISVDDSGAIVERFQITGDTSGLHYQRGDDTNTRNVPAGSWQGDRMPIPAGGEFQVHIGGKAK